MRHYSKIKDIEIPKVRSSLVLGGENAFWQKLNKINRDIYQAAGRDVTAGIEDKTGISVLTNSTHYMSMKRLVNEKIQLAEHPERWLQNLLPSVEPHMLSCTQMQFYFFEEISPEEVGLTSVDAAIRKLET